MLCRDHLSDDVGSLRVDEFDVESIEVASVCFVHGPGDRDVLTSLPDGVLVWGGHVEAVAWVVALPAGSGVDGAALGGAENGKDADHFASVVC